MKKNKVALLIDAENISSSYFDIIYTLSKQLDNIQISRVYGDFTKLYSWTAIARQFAIETIMQSSNSNGKNGADIKLVIDAMEILFTKEIDTFIIVSNDGDFTNLVLKLKEFNKVVIGMGITRHSNAFSNACDKFINLQDISNAKTNEEEKEERKEHKTAPKTQENAKNKENFPSLNNIKKFIKDKLESTASKSLHLSSLNTLLKKNIENFDHKNYGASKFSNFLQDLGFKIRKIPNSSHNEIYLDDLKAKKDEKDMILKSKKLENHIRELFKKYAKPAQGKDFLEISTLENELKVFYPNLDQIIKQNNCQNFKGFLAKLPFVKSTNSKINCYLV